MTSWWRAHRSGAQRHRHEAGDAGSIGIVLALLMVGMLAMAGLVIDGGAALAAKGRAADIAQQAARAGADTLQQSSLRNGDGDGNEVALRVDPDLAQQAAQRVLSLGGVTGEVTVDGDSVTVRASVQRRTAILSAVGLNTVTGNATASATALFGGVGEEGG